jgi:transcriptional regulator with XRE-family HTH domain
MPTNLLSNRRIGDRLNNPGTFDSVTPEGIGSVGSEIRALRKARGLTLNDLAEVSGVSVSHVSAIERGAVNPSLAKIEQLAKALAVSPIWFFTPRSGDGPLERQYVVRAENRRNLNLVYGEPAEVSGYIDWLLSSSIGGGFYMGLSEYLPTPNPDASVLYTRAGEAHVVVLEGELMLRLEDEEITLRAGDSFSIPGDVPHHTYNRSEATTRAIWVNAPVILPNETTHPKGKARGGHITRVGGTPTER